MIESIGIMQGRLLPKFQGRYQAHPVGYWQKEFEIAKNLDLGLIEFILDFNNFEINPLMTMQGLREIKALVDHTGVTVKSVCADYFMEAPLHSENLVIGEKSSLVLKQLIRNGAILGITDIVIPCVEQASLKNIEDQVRLVNKLTPLLDEAEKYNINLALETDLGPKPFLELLNMFDSERIKVNYDTGNSASLGYDSLEEFACYGDKISDIHIKDRQLGGGSVPLGSGDTDFNSFFTALSKIDYKGIFIMQVYRDDEGVDIFKRQFNWFKDLLKQ
jgi:sugar phosphate isomerase/epimerase